ncbi:MULTISPECIES: hypothetical protein [unclassified Microbacterium]|uniref:hypothetical protein n=1 Tax=unclassified Microbacterium TaxID=2609290 RepID=UPI000F54E8D3|nr:hypothetical protein [Microbacterium sp. ABRD28]AZC13755.1 hypothetical protein DT073_08560 [Microbacterium sp. ABRD28]
MSAPLIAAPLTSPTGPRPARPGAPDRTTERRLRPVEQTVPGARRRPRLAYGIVAVVAALAIAGVQMMLSILTTQSSYEISSLTQQQSELQWQRQMLSDDVAGLSSPQYLAANAAALGMVIEESPNYLRLSDGAVLGPGIAAEGGVSIDALGRGSVANNLIADRPLVTEPDATIQGAPVASTGDGLTDTPPPVADTLPTPATH